MTGLLQDVDVLVVGSGAAGLAAALTANANGMQTVVIERSKMVGGSSAVAGGGMWIPANRFMLADGDHDSREVALQFLEAVVGDAGPATSRARKEAFVDGCLRAVAFFEEQGMRFRRTTGYPDYYPDAPGGSSVGRGIESVIFDTTVLGEWVERLPKRVFPRNLPMGTLDVNRVVLAQRTPSGFARYMRILAHFGISRLRGQRLVGGGGALVAQFLHQVLQRGIPVLPETPLVDLIVEDDRVVGAVVEHQGEQVSVRARAGVLLGAGGFARNDEMRQEHQRHPVKAAWSSSAQSDLGDAIRLGIAAGAATALMDEAWWGPASLMPGGPAIFHVSERSKPGSIIVDQSAARYMNEAQSYVDAVHEMYQRDEHTPAIPSWMVFDTDYRNHYPFGTLLPRRTPRELIDNGYFKRAETIEDLARICDLDPAALVATVKRFNELARSGVDEDFGRGGNAYDRYYGDPRVKPNPCLAPLARPPYYATKLIPGDLGTKGGLVTDEHGRVLRDDGSVIAGLYASGNTTAAVMGRTYPGPGVTLAPAVTFSYLAMRHAASIAAVPRTGAQETSRR